MAIHQGAGIRTAAGAPSVIANQSAVAQNTCTPNAAAVIISRIRGNSAIIQRPGISTAAIQARIAEKRAIAQRARIRAAAIVRIVATERAVQQESSTGPTAGIGGIGGEQTIVQCGGVRATTGAIGRGIAAKGAIRSDTTRQAAATVVILNRIAVYTAVFQQAPVGATSIASGQVGRQRAIL